MQEINLNGEWILKQSGSPRSLRAQVPGCVHTDLLAAGVIPDPFRRDNEKRLQWISDTGWIYSRDFDVSAYFLKHDRVLLRCEMLDTLATVRINGREAGKADNMFRLWEFDAKRLLKPGRNRIEIRFSSVFPYIAERQKRRRFDTGASIMISGSPWIRKEPCNFGWDWGPQLVTCGIQRSIGLVAWNQARLTRVHIRQKHGPGKRVALVVNVSSERAGREGLKAVVSLWRRSRLLGEEFVSLKAGSGRARLRVENPELWWPAGMGEQPLYEVTVDLLNEAGDLLDTETKRIGLRRLELERKKDRWGESFQFKANGIPFFAKGANWIPADVFLSRLTEADYRRLLGDALAANMNMIRVWGGGIYEDDCFYDICDELGLCVWQDCMFACHPYPAIDREFMASVRLELADNVRRLRHHPSIALWCGNNEIEALSVGDKPGPRRMTWRENALLFDSLIPEEIAKHDPDRDYWPSSPHSPRGNRKDTNNPAFGDAHLWSVWHGMEPYEWYRTTNHRFVSEFGFQSFTEPKTMLQFTEPQDRNITSPVMEHHQRSGIGNAVIMHYMLSWFRMPGRFEDTLWLSQILQSLAIKYAVEHWRRNMPRSMGALYWQINDCWPVASWASIDFPGRWKALHYAAKKFFSPLLVSGVEDPKAGTIDLYVTSDLGKSRSGRLRWRVTDTSGRRLAGGARGIKIRPRASAKALRLDLRKLIRRQGINNVLVWMDLLVEGKVVSGNLATFARPKQMALSDPGISFKVGGAGPDYRVTLKAARPALWTWLECKGLDARLSDNFFHMENGRPVTITVTPAKPISRARLAACLKARSLTDTYR